LSTLKIKTKIEAYMTAKEFVEAITRGEE